MNNEERQLIINSIDHWQKDAVNMFDEGFQLGFMEFGHINLGTEWFHSKHGSIEGKLDSNCCPLCLKYLTHNYCLDCLWYKYAGKACDAAYQEYDCFMVEPTKENALKVIEKLWRIGTNE